MAKIEVAVLVFDNPLHLVGPSMAKIEVCTEACALSSGTCATWTRETHTGGQASPASRRVIDSRRQTQKNSQPCGLNVLQIYLNVPHAPYYSGQALFTSSALGRSRVASPLPGADGSEEPPLRQETVYKPRDRTGATSARGWGALSRVTGACIRRILANFRRLFEPVTANIGPFLDPVKRLRTCF